METWAYRGHRNDGVGTALGVAKAILRFIWNPIRVLLLVVLIVLEPLVGVVLTGTALIGFVVTGFLKLSGDVPSAHLWLLLIFSVSCCLLLAAYHGVVRILAR